MSQKPVKTIYSLRKPPPPTKSPTPSTSKASKVTKVPPKAKINSESTKTTPPAVAPSADIAGDDFIVVQRKRRGSTSSTTSNTSSLSSTSSSSSTPSTVSSLRPSPPKIHTTVIQTLPAEFATQKDFFKVLKSALPSLSTTSVAVYSNGTAVVKSTDEDLSSKIKSLDHHVGKPLRYVNPRPNPNKSTPAAPRKQSFSCVLKSVDHNISIDEIRSALDDAGLAHKNLWRIRSRATDKETTLVRVVTEVQATLDSLLLKGLPMYGRIYRCEPSHPTKPQPVQCTKCLHYGHQASACSQQPACARCGLSGHSVWRCPSVDKAPKCSNCKGDHPAYSTSCPSRPKEVPTTPSETAPVNCIDPTSDNDTDNTIRFFTSFMLNMFPSERVKVQETVSRLSKRFFARNVLISYTGNKVHMTITRLRQTLV